MNKLGHNCQGFALLMVLLLIAMSVVLGLSYMNSTAIRLNSSQNLVQATRAQYLAESGLEHALYVVGCDAATLDAATKAPQGPFFADDSDGSYTFFCVADTTVAGRYTITAEAQSAGITRRANMVVYRPPSSRSKVLHGLVVGGMSSTLPLGVEIEGDVFVNGLVINWSRVRGTIYATDLVFDLFRQADDAKPYQAAPIVPPDIQASQYRQYTIEDKTYNAVCASPTSISKNDNLVKHGTHASAGNIGSVLYLTPPNGRVELKDKVKFRGTIVVEGDLMLDGDKIELTAEPGFPAIVVTGEVSVTRNTDAVINGLVVAPNGIGIWGGQTQNSRTVINGGLVSNHGYQQGMKGDHKIKHVPELCEVWNFGSQGNGESSVRVIRVE